MDENIYVKNNDFLVFYAIMKLELGYCGIFSLKKI